MKQEEQIILLNSVKDKTLSRGCIITEGNILYTIDVEYFDENNYGYCTSIQKGEVIQHIFSDDIITKIIGHPFYYGYAIDWIEKQKYMVSFQLHHKFRLEELWKDKTKDIEAEENEEALEYFTGLIKEQGQE